MGNLECAIFRDELVITSYDNDTLRTVIDVLNKNGIVFSVVSFPINTTHNGVYVKDIYAHNALYNLSFEFEKIILN